MVCCTSEGSVGVCTGAGGLLDATNSWFLMGCFNSSFGTLADSIKVAPQFLQNLSLRLTSFPHFGQKFAIILIFLIDFRYCLNFSLNWHFVK